MLPPYEISVFGPSESLCESGDSGPLESASRNPDLLSRLEKICGLDLDGYRRNLVETHLEKCRKAAGASSVSAWLAEIAEDPAECRLLADALLVQVSRFYRNPLAFEMLADRFIPLVLAESLSSASEFRVWSAGCSTGEEAWSLAVLLTVTLEAEQDERDFRIFATDIHPASLGTARRGCYPFSALSNLRLSAFSRFFSRREDEYAVTEELRRRVHFSRDELRTSTTAPAESIFGSFHLIFCRNVLIYYEPEIQTRIIKRLHRNLCPGGILTLGRTETLAPGTEHLFYPLDSGCRIYRKQKGAVCR